MGWKPFNPTEESAILTAIKDAENKCSGEIRVHVDQYCKSDPMFKAKNVFNHLEMDQTELKNGVLIYVAVKDRKFSIIGDIGINEKVPEDFWESTIEIMIKEFASGNLSGGIVAGIQKAGEQLKHYFPYQNNDLDELPDDISYGA